MHKLFVYCALTFGLIPYVASQSSVPDASSKLRSEQIIFQNLNTRQVDSLVMRQLNHFVRIQADSLKNWIINDKSLDNEAKSNGIFSIAAFIQGMGETFRKEKTDVYDLPLSIPAFNSLLVAVLKKQGYDEILKPLTAQRTQLLANAFFKFEEFSRLRDLALYKRIVSSPKHILHYVQLNPAFRYSDSLLLYAAADDPVRVGVFLKRSPAGLGFAVRYRSNPFIKQILLYSEDALAEDILPFIPALSEGKITVEEIKTKRADVTRYFQLLVNSLKSIVNGNCNDCYSFETALRKGIKEKAIEFFVDPINDLHNAKNEQRFASIKGLRPEDLYYVITSAEQELYTSSYLGLFRRLMDYCKKSATDSLFRLVNYDQFRVFMRMAANYNTLNDFFSCLPVEVSKDLLHRFSSGIATDVYDGVEKAMDLADAFNGVAKDSLFSNLLSEELLLNLKKNANEGNAFGTKLYTILWRIYNMVVTGAEANSARLGNYEKLENKRLQDREGRIIQHVLFYGDEDGKSSFESFIKSFSDSLLWDTTHTEQWVAIKSRSGKPLFIYANKPLDNESGEDLRAQVELHKYLNEKSIVPSVVIHRGHSYFLETSLSYMNASVKLAFLGSCGGANNLISVANISPDAHIIVSKKIGAKAINDPLIATINLWLLQNKDLNWKEIWKALEERFKQDEESLNLFREYIPPPRNVSLFVMKLFNQT